MITHIFYKEWLKTKWFAAIAVLLGLTIVSYIFLDVNNNIRLNGTFNYLMRVFYGIPQANYYRDLLRYLPLLIALAIGLSQYVPEVLDKRIKLTLHLPIGNTQAIYLMLLYGFGLLMIAYLIIFGTFFALNNIYFPFEESWAVLISITPWLLGGIVAYFMVAMIAMEPNLLYQMFYGVVAFFLVKQFFVGMEHADTRFLIGTLAVLAFIPSIALLYTSYRFIKGER